MGKEGDFKIENSNLQTVAEIEDTHNEFYSYGHFALSMDQGKGKSLESDWRFADANDIVHRGYVVSKKTSTCIVAVVKGDGTTLYGEVGWKKIYIPIIDGEIESYAVGHYETEGIDDMPLTIIAQPPSRV